MILNLSCRNKIDKILKMYSEIFS